MEIKLQNVVNFKPSIKKHSPAFNGNIASSEVSNTKLPVPGANLLKVYFTGQVEKPKTIISAASVDEKKAIESFGTEYMNFLQNTKTNLSAAKEIVKAAKVNGYKPLDEMEQLKPGDKVYFVNNDRAVVMATIGQNPVTKGVRMVASHLDSPHITLKANPLQESQDYCVFKTMMHGLNSKRYQWVNRHLALEGKVVTNDGRTVEINIGNKPGENTFVIPDLAPHVDGDANKSKEFKAEEMMPVVALNSEAETKISDYVEKMLKDKYNITREDLVNAELNLVPAEGPREIGFDSGLIGAYGHDDKSCVFASLKSELDKTEIPEFTSVSAFFGNEEIGSDNNYGAKSDFIKQAIAGLIEKQKGSYNENDIRRAMKHSLALSADVSTAIDPIKPAAEEASNACKLGHGIIMKLQGWRNSRPEATSFVTRLFKKNDIRWQPFAYNQDKGGGSTLGIYLATDLNMDVVDVGVPILSMHAPVEIADKGDLYHLYRGMKEFLTGKEQI